MKIPWWCWQFRTSSWLASPPTARHRPLAKSSHPLCRLVLPSSLPPRDLAEFGWEALWEQAWRNVLWLSSLTQASPHVVRYSFTVPLWRQWRGHWQSLLALPATLREGSRIAHRRDLEAWLTEDGQWLDTWTILLGLDRAPLMAPPRPGGAATMSPAPAAALVSSLSAVELSLSSSDDEDEDDAAVDEGRVERATRPQASRSAEQSWRRLRGAVETWLREHDDDGFE